MPKRDEVPYLVSQVGTYSKKVEGTPALLRRDLVLPEDLAVGDKVKLFSLPDGKQFVSKVEADSPEGFVIRRLTAAHIYFDGEISIQEA
jgi:hypothetical protein